MDRAKAAISDFVGRSGHHDTRVVEELAPAVTKEVIQPVKETRDIEVKRKEIDVEHRHTTIQPLVEEVVLPKTETHQMAPVRETYYEDANPHETRARLEREAQQFKDTSITKTTIEKHIEGPEIENEVTHHHVIETIQPVVEKTVIQPTVIHRTIPVVEHHHAPPEFHGVSVLPTKTVSEFKGNLTGSSGIINEDHYDGCPRPYNPDMQLSRTEADANPHLHSPVAGGDHHHQRASPTTAGPRSSDLANKMDPRVDSDRDGRGGGAGLTGTGHHATAGPHTSDTANKLDPRVDSDRSGGYRSGPGGEITSPTSPNSLARPTSLNSSTSPTSPTSAHASGADHHSTHKKPSLLDRLNPLKDSDGDGAKGFMK